MITYIGLLLAVLALGYLLVGSIRRRQPASQWLSSRQKIGFRALVIVLFVIAALTWAASR